MAKTSCPIPKGAENYGIRGSQWHVMVWISLACTIVTLAVSLSLCFLHLRRYRAPKEQRQIIRIVLSVVVYSLVAFFELYSYEAAQYIDPVGDVYEAFGLCALFLLFIQYAAPTNKFNDDTLAAARSAAEKEFGYDWVRIAWVFVFQYPLVELFCVILQEATEATGTYCLQSLSPRYAHLWLEILESVSISFCVLAIVNFYTSMKVMMKMRRGLSKIIAFKIIVGIRFSQAWIFSTLLEDNVIKTSSSFSYNDILYGIPAVLTCAEMVLFAAGFWYAYSSTEYSSTVHSRDEPLPFFKAVLHALNPSDLISGIFRVPVFAIQLHQRGDWAGWRAKRRENWRKLRQNLARRIGLKTSSPSSTSTQNPEASGSLTSPRYTELGTGLDNLSRPSVSHAQHMHSDSAASSQPAYEFPLAADSGSPPSNANSRGRRGGPGAGMRDVYNPPPPDYGDSATPSPSPSPSPPLHTHAQHPSRVEESSTSLMPDSTTLGLGLGGTGGGNASKNPATAQQQQQHIRSPSGSYLMVSEAERAASAQQGSLAVDGRRYDRSPSPDPRFERAPVQGRDMV